METDAEIHRHTLSGVRNLSRRGEEIPEGDRGVKEWIFKKSKKENKEVNQGCFDSKKDKKKANFPQRQIRKIYLKSKDLRSFYPNNFYS